MLLKIQPETHSTIVQWVVLFAVVYVLSSVIFFFKESWGFSSKKRPFDAASRVIGLIHSSTLIVLGMQALSTVTEWELSAPNREEEVHILAIGAAYFLVDLMHFLVFDNKDIIFIAHHLVALGFYFSVMISGYTGLANTVASLCPS